MRKRHWRQNSGKVWRRRRDRSTEHRSGSISKASKKRTTRDSRMNKNLRRL